MERKQVVAPLAQNKPRLVQRNFGVQFYLEDPQVRPFDLVTERSLRTELPPHKVCQPGAGSLS